MTLIVGQEQNFKTTQRCFVEYFLKFELILSPALIEKDFFLLSLKDLVLDKLF